MINCRRLTTLGRVGATSAIHPFTVTILVGILRALEEAISRGRYHEYRGEDAHPNHAIQYSVEMQTLSSDLTMSLCCADLQRGRNHDEPNHGVLMLAVCHVHDPYHAATMSKDNTSRLEIKQIAGITRVRHHSGSRPSKGSLNETNANFADLEHRTEPSDRIFDTRFR